MPPSGISGADSFSEEDFGLVHDLRNLIDEEDLVGMKQNTFVQLHRKKNRINWNLHIMREVKCVC
jgi:hypothetical protein